MNTCNPSRRNLTLNASSINEPAALRPITLWPIILSAVLIGPFVGGMPYLYWTIYSVVVAYAIGIVPALVGGTLFAFWLRAVPTADLPSGWKGAWKGALHGGFFGSTGCGLCAIVLALFTGGGDGYGFYLFVILHGLVAGFFTGGIITYCNNRRKTGDAS